MNVKPPEYESTKKTWHVPSWSSLCFFLLFFFCILNGCVTYSFVTQIKGKRPLRKTVFFIGIFTSFSSKHLQTKIFFFFLLLKTFSNKRRLRIEFMRYLEIRGKQLRQVIKLYFSRFLNFFISKNILFIRSVRN